MDSPVFEWTPMFGLESVCSFDFQFKITKNSIGNTLFETPTCVNGGKAPHWNRTVNAYLPDEVESIYLQIFDEVNSKYLN